MIKVEKVDLETGRVVSTKTNKFGQKGESLKSGFETVDSTFAKEQDKVLSED